MEIFLKEPGEVQVLITSIACAFEGPNVRNFNAGACKDEDRDDTIYEMGDLAVGLRGLTRGRDTVIVNDTIVENSD